MNCIKCQKNLAGLDVALTKKLLGKALTNFLCIDCLAKEFNVSKELLIEKARQFKSTGCLLFDGVDI